MTLPRLSRPVRRLLIAASIVLLMAPAASACPACKAALASSDDGSGGDLVSGFFWSILFMVSMPFAITGAFGFSIYRATRRGRIGQSLRSDATGDPTAEPRDQSPTG